MRIVHDRLDAILGSRIAGSYANQLRFLETKRRIIPDYTRDIELYTFRSDNMRVPLDLKKLIRMKEDASNHKDNLKPELIFGCTKNSTRQIHPFRKAGLSMPEKSLSAALRNLMTTNGECVDPKRLYQTSMHHLLWRL